jgi:hypothetical protein
MKYRKLLLAGKAEAEDTAGIHYQGTANEDIDLNCAVVRSRVRGLMTAF